MKHIYYALLLVCTLLGAAGCDNHKYMGFANPQQKAFDTFLANKRAASYNAGNDIQKNEFYKSYEADLQSYLDTIPLFVNWQGIIKDIKVNEIRNSTELSFDVFYQPEKYREITFHCSHIIPNDSLSTDYLYNTVKNMPNYMVVYFDGYIRRNIDNGVVYAGYYSDGLQIPYPKYSFNFVFIDPESRDNLTTNLRNAIGLDFKVIEPLKLSYRKEITKDEADTRYENLRPQYEAAQSLLTEQEKRYSQRLRTYLVNDFLYGN